MSVWTAWAPPLLDGLVRLDRLASEDGLVRPDRLGSAPDGEVDGEVVREIGSGSAPVREGSTPEVRAVRAGRPEGGRPNRGRQCSRF